jgi:hypothetical protein
MHARHRCFRFAVVASALALTSSGALAQGLTESCSSPAFPGPVVSIDSRCSAQGAGGTEADQNQAKNNFCALGAPSRSSIAALTALQAQVGRNSAINFGDKDNPGAHGPATNRAPLKALGEGKLVQLKAFVVAATQEGDETVNCGKDFDHESNKDLFHDIHISLVAAQPASLPTTPAEKDATECPGIVSEMIPHHRPPEWTADNVNKVAAKHLMVRVTGQLFFDSSHVPCAQGKEVRTNPRRATLWEIHPIYKFDVCTANCNAAGTWVPLAQWVKQPTVVTHNDAGDTAGTHTKRKHTSATDAKSKT